MRKAPAKFKCRCGRVFVHKITRRCSYTWMVNPLWIAWRFKLGRTLESLYRAHGRHVVDAAVRGLL